MSQLSPPFEIQLISKSTFQLLGKIPLVSATLLDDDLFGIPGELFLVLESFPFKVETWSSCSVPTQPPALNSSVSMPSPLTPVKESPSSEFEGRYFKLAVSHAGTSYLFIFVAPTNQEKEAWVTDIGQVSIPLYISYISKIRDLFAYLKVISIQ